jgi:hypothetical protein
MLTHRRWLTPLLTGSFVLLAVTGVLLFFHLSSPLARASHEWPSWIFLVAAILHLVLNARPLLAALRPHLARATVAAFALVALAAIFTGGEHSGPGGAGRHHGPPGASESPESATAVEALSRAPLDRLAAVLETSPGALHRKLEAGGIEVPADQSSVQEIAAVNQRQPRAVLDAVFR